MSKITIDVSNYEAISHETEDLTPLCRACLRKQVNMKFLPLNLEDTNLLLKRLTFLLNIEITLAENTPMYLCNTCEENINISYTFKAQCVKSNDYIQNWIRSRNANTLFFEGSLVNSEISRKEEQIPDKSDLTEYQCSSCNTTFKNFKQAYSEDSASLCHLCKFQTLGSSLELEKEEVKADYDDDTLKVDFQDFKEEQCVPQQKQKTRLKRYSAEAIRNIIDEVKKKHNGQVTCKFCKFTAQDNRSLSVHMGRVHSQIKNTWCSICNETFEDVKQHHREVHFEDLKCPFCSKIKKNMGKFVEHMAYHTGRLFQCSVCGSSFNFLRHLKSHQLHNHGNQILPKTNSDKLISEPGTDIKPAQVPESVKTVKSPKKKHLCSHCGKQFIAYHKLVIHIRSHTGETPYQCNHCDKGFKVRSHYLLHERTHTGERPYKCEFCDKSFSQSSTLKTHLKIHTGKTIECTMCDKTFCRVGAMKVHMREHTGEKPYICEICGQTFRQKSHLVEHSKRHSEERPFECSYCERTFKNNHTMKVHEQIHTGDKPYQCSQCSYACRQAYSLTQHMKQHDNDKPQGHCPHICHVCQRTYSTLAHLFTHIRRFHPNTIETVTLEEEEAIASDPDEPKEVILEESSCVPLKVEVLGEAPLIESVPEEMEVISDQVGDSVLEFTVLN